MNQEPRHDPRCEGDASAGEIWEIARTTNAYVSAAGGGRVYYATGGFSGSVYSLPRDGGNASLLASDQPSIRRMAYFDGAVAWTTTGWTSPGGTLVEWRNGSLLTHRDQLYQPMGIDMDATLLCVADGFQDSRPADTGIGKVHCIDRRTDRVEVVVDGFARVHDVALDAYQVFFSDPLRGNLHRMERGRWQVEVFAALARPQFLSLTRERLYVSSGTTVSYVPLDSKVATALADLGGSYLRTIVADDAGVYVVVTDFAGSDVFRYVTLDGTQIDLAEGQGSVGSLVLDATRLYWSGSDSSAESYLRSRCRL